MIVLRTPLRISGWKRYFLRSARLRKCDCHAALMIHRAMSATATDVAHCP
jgi:hypothetical protein